MNPLHSIREIGDIMQNIHEKSSGGRMRDKYSYSLVIEVQGSKVPG